jgi:gluconokinase
MEVSSPAGGDGNRARRAIVVMGVSGCGKTVVGEALASRLGAAFIEGDRLHPPENVARMAASQPLTDAHRAGWLDKIGTAIAQAHDEGQGVVAACSALKRIYRDRLRDKAGAILFVHLDVSPLVARARVGRRKGHFMPASLVDSQFADLERPGRDEDALTMDGTLPVEDIVTKVVAAMSLAA